MRGKWEVLHTSGAGVCIVTRCREFIVTIVKLILDSKNKQYSLKYKQGN